jgi:hypothetical protein
MYPPSIAAGPIVIIIRKSIFPLIRCPTKLDTPVKDDTAKFVPIAKNELCNFLVLDNIADGIYIFEAVTNVSKIFEEDSYDDNTVFVKLMIKIQERIADPIPL